MKLELLTTVEFHNLDKDFGLVAEFTAAKNITHADDSEMLETVIELMNGDNIVADQIYSFSSTEELTGEPFWCHLYRAMYTTTGNLYIASFNFDTEDLVNGITDTAVERGTAYFSGKRHSLRYFGFNQALHVHLPSPREQIEVVLYETSQKDWKWFETQAEFAIRDYEHGGVRGQCHIHKVCKYHLANAKSYNVQSILDKEGPIWDLMENRMGDDMNILDYAWKKGIVTDEHLRHALQISSAKEWIAENL